MTFDEIVRLAEELPEVEEGLSYGTPSLTRKGRFMLRLKEDGDTIAIKLDWESHDRLLAQKPALYFKTPHYDGYPAFLARLDDLNEDDVVQLLRLSWTDAPKPAKRLRKEAKA